MINCVLTIRILITDKKVLLEYYLCIFVNNFSQTASTSAEEESRQSAPGLINAEMLSTAVSQATSMDVDIDDSQAEAAAALPPSTNERFVKY